MKRTVLKYARDGAGEVLIVRSHSWLWRYLGRKGHTQHFWRPARNAFWYTTPEAGPSSVVSPRFSRKLDDLRDGFEHDNGHLPIIMAEPPPREAMSAPRDHVVLAQLDECDCGRAHPTGYICMSAWRDRL